MNKTLVYISTKYNNPGLAYLALFALTPHPYNKDAVYVDPQTGERVHTSNLRNARSAANREGKRIIDSDVLRTPGTEAEVMHRLEGASALTPEDQAGYKQAKAAIKQGTPFDEIPPETHKPFIDGNSLDSLKNQTEGNYRPSQIQAIQRKHMLRESALNLPESSAIMPKMTKGATLQSSYNLLRNKNVRSVINDTGTLDRYERHLRGQVFPGEENMPKISVQQAQEAKARLAGLTDDDWDILDKSHRALYDIRADAKPISTNISKNTSPIGRAAKPDTLDSLKNRQTLLQNTAAEQGIDPRTIGKATPDLAPNPSALKAAIPSYVTNPESVQYVVDPTPSALANKGKPMKVGYTPAGIPKEPGRTTGIENRLERFDRARELTQSDKLPMRKRDKLRSTAREIATKARQTGVDAAAAAKQRGSATVDRFKTRRAERQQRRLSAQNIPTIDVLSGSSRPKSTSAYDEAIRQQIMQPSELPVEEARRLAGNMPVAPKPTTTPINSASAPTTPGRLPGKNYQTQNSIVENTRDLAGKVKEPFSNLGNWYINNIVNPTNKPPAPLIQTVTKLKPLREVETTETTPPVAKTKRTVAKTKPPVATPPPQSSVVGSTLDYYDRMRAARQMPQAPVQEPVQEVAQAVKPQSLKLKNLLRGFPKMSPQQKRGLLTLGAGVAGSGGVLLGGSMLANNLISQQQEQAIKRNEQLYGNPYSYPPQPVYGSPYPPPTY